MFVRIDVSLLLFQTKTIARIWVKFGTEIDNVWNNTKATYIPTLYPNFRLHTGEVAGDGES